MPGYADSQLRQPRAERASSTRTPTPSTATAPWCCSTSASTPTTGWPTSCRPSGCRPRSCPTTSTRSCSTPGRLLEHWHTGSMTRRSFALDAIAPRAEVYLHPADAAELGRRRRRHGAGRVAAGLDRAAGAGVPPRGAAATCFIPFHFREAAANVLTNDAIDPFGKIPEFKFCAVRIEPALMAARPAAPVPASRRGPASSRAQPDPGPERDPATSTAGCRARSSRRSRRRAGRCTRSRG